MSDGYKVIYSPAAFDDIRKIYSYIEFELQVPDTTLLKKSPVQSQYYPTKNYPCPLDLYSNFRG